MNLEQPVLAGSTVTLRPLLDGGRRRPDRSREIGATWLSASAQRTRCNTEAKYLMLIHAFDVWLVHRVALKTDERNSRSRQAIDAGDIVGARANRVRSIGVLWGYGSESELGDAGADGLCATPDDLAACLGRLAL
jgi:hypothetical protein